MLSRREEEDEGRLLPGPKALIVYLLKLPYMHRDERGANIL